jgi:hypothetical protein
MIRRATAGVAITKVIMQVMAPVRSYTKIITIQVTVPAVTPMIRSQTQPGLYYGNIDLGVPSSQKLLAICGNFNRFRA